MRTEPNAADRHLIRILARNGLQLSPYQLERWRTVGLIPRLGPHTLLRIGDSKVHPPATAVLVAGLATCAPLCRTQDDLALLAFFNEVPVPPDAVRAALAEVYFPQHAEAREQEYVHLQRIPADHRGEHGPEYDWAEAAAAPDTAEYKAAVRQMRDNLRRRRDLATASRAELDGRVRGVLIWLNMPALPVHDSEFMADLRAAMAFSGSPENSRAAWLLAAVCHSQQLAKGSETCAQERRETLLAVTDEELGALREQVRESMDAMWFMATEGRSRHFRIESSGDARQAGRMLAEWTTARHAFPSGSRPAQVLVDSLCSLWYLCSTDTVGEGRAAFEHRTRPPHRAP